MPRADLGICCLLTLCVNMTEFEYYWDRPVWAKNVDLDLKPQNSVPDQGLQCLPII